MTEEAPRGDVTPGMPTPTCFAMKTLVPNERWFFVMPFIPHPGRHKRRAMLAAIIYALNQDCPWDAIPDVPELPPPNTLDAKFAAWTTLGLWRQIAEAAIGTPHQSWAQALARSAFHRIHHEPCWQPTESIPVELDTDRVHIWQIFGDQYATVRDIMNRPDLYSV